MNDRVKIELDNFMQGVIHRNPGELEFHQAVREVCESLMPFVLENRKYRDANFLERLTEPDRTIIYRVCWEDDHGTIQTNRACAFSSTIPSARTKAACAFIRASINRC